MLNDEQVPHKLRFLPDKMDSGKFTPLRSKGGGAVNRQFLEAFKVVGFRSGAFKIGDCDAETVKHHCR
jgi:hypothetical protein